MEEMRAALSAKGYDIVGEAESSDSDDDPMPGRIPSIEPNKAREKGKEAFEKGKYDKAIKFWQGGLKSILSALCSGPEAMSNTSLSELDLTLNLNIAMAYMRKGDFDAADRSVDKALARRDALPAHQITKALYRKASAQRAMNRLDETLETLKDLLEVDATNAAALKMHQEVDREWTRQKKQQNANFKKLFSKMQGEDQKEAERLRQERAEARIRSGVRWTDEDVDSEAFERGEAPGCDGRDWGLALSRTVLWSIEQLAVEGHIALQPEVTHAAAWFLGVSSTCELRWLQASALMSRLPSVSTLELNLIGFLGEKDPENKQVPDPRADNLPGDVSQYALAGSPNRRMLVRAIKGTLQDALKADLLEVAEAMEATGTSAASYGSAAPAVASETSGGYAEVSGEVAETSVPAPVPPHVCYIAHPQLHRYFSDFYPAIVWLIQKRVPTIIIGASAPDLSWT